MKLTTLELFDASDLASCFGKTFQACSQQKTTHSVASWAVSLAQTLPFRPAQDDGRVVVMLPAQKEKRHGESSMLNISESPNAADECLLSQVLTGGGIDPTEVLFERAGVLGDSEEGFRKGQAIAGRSQNSTGESSEVNDINVDVCYDISHPCDIVRESMNITPTLQSAMGTGGNRVPLVISKNKEVSYSIAENIIGRQPKNGGNGSGFNEEICYTLNATGVHGVAHCFKIRGGSGDGRKGYLGQDEKAFTLATHQDQQLFTMNRVRKLTPLECERLQGFPDNWTRIPYRGKSEEDCPDSPRYKAIGNSWAVPCVRWIGKRINKKTLTTINNKPRKRGFFIVCGVVILLYCGIMFTSNKKEEL